MLRVLTLRLYALFCSKQRVNLCISNFNLFFISYMVPLAPPAFLTQLPGGDTDEELGIVDDETGSDHSPERETEIVTFSG